MSNKKIFKEIYSKKINKDNNYQKTLKSINNYHIKNNIYKKALVPITSILLISTLIFINTNGKKDIDLQDATITNQNNNYEIYINDESKNNTNTSKSDIDIQRKIINYKELINNKTYSFLNNLNIPKNLDDITYQAIYTSDNILYNYEFLYQNNNQKIILSFSDSYKPLRNNSTNEEKISKINNTEVIIYQNKNSYIVTFTYNNINFDIETNNISKEELINILISIII